MTINQQIQSALVTACSGITSNVYYYLIAITKEFTTSDTLVTYELNNTENIHTAEFKNAVKMYDVIVKVTSNKQSTISNLHVFIVKNLLCLTGNVGYISLTNDEQPIYNPESMMFSSSMTFAVQWVS